MAEHDLLRGTLDVLILKALAVEPLHGLGVSRRVHALTGGTFDVQPGSLFPALHRLEEQGWLSASWGESENKRRARFYKLTASGRRQLKRQTDTWDQVSAAIGRALSTSS
jgi:transcriptional regulator